MSDLEDLYRAHIGAAMRAAWMIVGDADRAADLVQEAFVRCVSRLGGIRDVQGFGRYWQRTVLSVAMNQFRHADSERRTLRRLWAGRVDSAVDLEVGVADRITLSSALAALPSRQRAVLVARYYLDMSEADTAHALGMRPGTVKSTTSRALAALRIQMQDGITT
jgi:RNA polymerase sigma factor (sigma-70 family)